jgi:hypothetical protein
MFIDRKRYELRAPSGVRSLWRFVSINIAPLRGGTVASSFLPYAGGSHVWLRGLLGGFPACRYGNQDAINHFRISICMKYLTRLSIALLTFIIGISSTLWWHLLRHHEPSANVALTANNLEDGLAHEQGVYFNYEYGYSITIPDGLTGYRSPVPLPQHGIGIHLSKQDCAQVWMDGAYNSLEWGSLKEAAEFEVRALKAPNISNIQLMRLTYGRLSRLRAVRIVVAYNKSGLQMVEDEAVAIRKERDIVYTLQLRTTAARYPQDVEVLNQLERSFRLEALQYP